MVGLKIHSIKQNRVKVPAVSYGQYSETTGCNFFKFCKSLANRILLLQSQKIINDFMEHYFKLDMLQGKRICNIYSLIN